MWMVRLGHMIFPLRILQKKGLLFIPSNDLMWKQLFLHFSHVQLHLVTICPSSESLSCFVAAWKLTNFLRQIMPRIPHFQRFFRSPLVKIHSLGNLIDQALACLRWIAKSKGHVRWVKKTEWCHHGCLLNVLHCSWYLVECSHQVEVNYVSYEITIRNSAQADRSIVPAQLPVSVVLGNHMKRSWLAAGRWTDRP